MILLLDKSVLDRIVSYSSCNNAKVSVACLIRRSARCISSINFSIFSVYLALYSSSLFVGIYIMDRIKKTANMGAYQKRAYLRRKAQLKAEYDAKVAEKSEKLKYMLENNIPLNDFKIN
jgi:hypothetical protein